MVWSDKSEKNNLVTRKTLKKPERETVDESSFELLVFLIKFFFFEKTSYGGNRQLNLNMPCVYTSYVMSP